MDLISLLDHGAIWGITAVTLASLLVTRGGDS